MESSYKAIDKMREVFVKKHFIIFIAASWVITGLCLAQNDYVKKIKELRKQKDEEFATSEISPLAPVAHFHFKVGSPLVISFSESGVKEGESPEAHHQLQFTWEGSRLFVESRGADDELMVDGTPTRGKFELYPGKVVKICHFALSYSEIADKMGRIMVFDLNSEEKNNFKGLIYFPVNPAYRVKARLTRILRPEKVEILTHQNLLKIFLRYAYLDFEIDGTKCRLTAYKMPGAASSKKLFILFKDLTSGRETYAAGRFLEAEENGNECTLDFNLAYNPLCAYNPHWNCPIPPEENWLKVKIKAGEMNYQGLKH